MSTEHISTADLDWLAFQYAAGELQGAELEGFEKLLATDDRACAALAQAVMLGEAVVHCEQSGQIIIPRTDADFAGKAGRSAHRASYSNLIAASTVACSLLFVGWMLVQTPHRNVSHESASAVAQLWIEGADEGSATEAVLPDRDAADLVEEEPVPGWLLAALNHQQAGEDGEILMND